MLHDSHHIQRISDRLFDSDLNTKTMTVKDLKDTLKKWGVLGITSSTLKKADLVGYLESLVAAEEFSYNRVNIKPSNGPPVWYETRGDCRFKEFERTGTSTGDTEAYKLKICKTVCNFTDINIETYKLKICKKVHNFTYDPDGNKWYENFNLKNGEYYPIQKSGQICYRYNELRTVLTYTEKWNDYFRVLLIEEFLNKDITSYIRSFL